MPAGCQSISVLPIMNSDIQKTRTKKEMKIKNKKRDRHMLQNSTGVSVRGLIRTERYPNRRNSQSSSYKMASVEKALKLIRNLPRVSLNNLKPLPRSTKLVSIHNEASNV